MNQETGSLHPNMFIVIRITIILVRPLELQWIYLHDIQTFKSWLITFQPRLAVLNPTFITIITVPVPTHMIMMMMMIIIVVIIIITRTKW